MLGKGWRESRVASSPHILTNMNTQSHTFNRRKALWAAGVLALAGAFAAGAQSVSSDDSKPAVEVKRDTQPVNRGPLETGSFSSVVKSVAPSVVKITTSTKARKVAADANQSPGFDNPMFR